VLWVPPEGVKQRSLFMNVEVVGLQFLPPDKIGRAVDAGKYPLCAITHPPTFWRLDRDRRPLPCPRALDGRSNALVTHSHSLEVEEALGLLEFTVVSDFFLTPTAQFADIFLPAATWLEQDDIANIHKIWCVLGTPGKSRRRGEARDDRQVMLDLAHRLGLTDAFPWRTLPEYFDWVLEDAGMDFDQFCEKGILEGEMTYNKYETRGFATPTGKLEFASTILESMGLDPLPVYRSRR